MKLGIAFSGGKDSFACLFLNKDHLDEIHVIWINSGKAYPETLEIVEFAKSFCPLFHEIRTDRDGQNETDGIPSDLVPIKHTSLGMEFVGTHAIRIQSTWDCCWANISFPLLQAASNLGITHLIRGQRQAEKYKTQASNGAMINGITFLHPLENWSSERVMAYLETQMEIPEHFRLNPDHTSLDCYDCTGFFDLAKTRSAWMKDRHPEYEKLYQGRRALLRKAIRSSMKEFGK